jgi:hypothetical protein
MLAIYRNQFYETERHLAPGSLRASEAEAARKSSISLWSTSLDYTSLNCSLRPP